MDQVNKAKNSSLPPIGQLFKEAWNTFKRSLLQLILLNILGMAVYFLLAALAFVILVLSGLGSSILQKGLMGLSAITPLSGIIFLAIGVISLIIAAAAQICAVLIVNDKAQTKLVEKFKKSFSYIWPLFLINLVTGFLTIGGSFLFVIPGILFIMLFSYVQFEVILNNQLGLSSIKRSVGIISKNFGEIFIRYLLLILIYFGISIVLSIFKNILPQELKWLPNIISSIIHMFWGWFMLAFSIVLYKQSKSVTSNEEVSNIIWIWIVAVLGWLIALSLTIITWKVLYPEVLKDVETKLPQTVILNSVKDFPLSSESSPSANKKTFGKN